MAEATIDTNGLMPVADARARILEAMAPVSAESVSLAEARGRVLAEDVIARVTQPPVAVSAMDGYAVRAQDVATVPSTLTVIGEAPAGGAFEGTVGAGQAVRIFTGGPVPSGANAIVIQEDTDRDGDQVSVKEAAIEGRFIRPAGLDFSAGDAGLQAGRILTARDIALCAAMNVPWLRVRRKPRVAVLANGDELVMPGEAIGPNQIVSSNNVGICALINASGGEAIDLGIAPDNAEGLLTMAAGARGADLLITIGGASVGDHDLIQSVLGEKGLEVDFWRIAMRPGKPLIFGHFGDVPMLGLPGNPVSALVCGLIFMKPAIAALSGADVTDLETRSAILTSDLGENDQRQDYLRATTTKDSDSNLTVTPFGKQDSSMLSRLARADALILRPPHAPAVKAGDVVEIIDLGPLGY
jgi:molybdopterin molybdotransferase